MMSTSHLMNEVYGGNLFAINQSFKASNTVSVLLLLCFGLSMAFASVDRLTFDPAQFWIAVKQYGGQSSTKQQSELSTLLATPYQDMNIDALTKVNRYFNESLLYQTDDAVWLQKDYWASPAESIAKGAGDCEDYAIAKYFFLLHLGVPPSQLRLVYVKAKIGGRRSTVTQAHMVLGFYPSGRSEPLILDNLIGDILPASQRTDLSPVFSFNSEGIFQPGQTASVGQPSARLSQWRNVMVKLKQEGFDINE